MCVCVCVFGGSEGLWRRSGPGAERRGSEVMKQGPGFSLSGGAGSVTRRSDCSIKLSGSSRLESPQTDPPVPLLRGGGGEGWIDREADRQTSGWTEKCMDGQIDAWTDRKRDRQKESEDRLMKTQTDGWRHRHSKGQTQINRQTE